MWFSPFLKWTKMDSVKGIEVITWLELKMILENDIILLLTIRWRGWDALKELNTKGNNWWLNVHTAAKLQIDSEYTKQNRSHLKNF